MRKGVENENENERGKEKIVTQKLFKCVICLCRWLLWIRFLELNAIYSSNIRHSTTQFWKFACHSDHPSVLFVISPEKKYETKKMKKEIPSQCKNITHKHINVVYIVAFCTFCMRNLENTIVNNRTCISFVSWKFIANVNGWAQDDIIVIEFLMLEGNCMQEMKPFALICSIWLQTTQQNPMGANTDFRENIFRYFIG